MTVHPIHAGPRMGMAALVLSIGTIALLILTLVAGWDSWWVLAMFAVNEVALYKAFSSSVRRRRRDLALLRCFGASRSQVFAGVLTEAAWVGVFGTVAGLLIVLVLLGLPHFNLVVFALFVGVAGAVLAALVPAVRASRIPPSGPALS